MAPAAATTPQASIFNSVEVRKEGLKPFPKWTGALDKYFEERGNNPGGCEETKFNACHYKEWQKLLDSARDLDLMGKLKAVNKYMNKYKYIVDPLNWGVQDYWASPGEFFHKYGDCEDYAISKFLSLRALDVPADIMRVFIVQDMNLKVAHAILGVYVDGEVQILDNQIALVVSAARIRHYKPIFSVNETGWWKHKVRD